MTSLIFTNKVPTWKVRDILANNNNNLEGSQGQKRCSSFVPPVRNKSFVTLAPGASCLKKSNKRR
jgi:hypothetical protein